jgi:hypothetical protein
MSLLNRNIHSLDNHGLSDRFLNLRVIHICQHTINTINYTTISLFIFSELPSHGSGPEHLYHTLNDNLNLWALIC